MQSVNEPGSAVRQFLLFAASRVRRPGRRSLVLGAVLTLILGLPAAGRPDKVKEVSPSDEELKKLDRFEEHTLSKADQTFHKKQYRQARAEYDSFIIEFPRSKLIPYALLRKGRCAQLDNKRLQAIADYKEILDYFPNDVKYAAAALYFIGDCHHLNGDISKAIQAWIKLAEDEDYRRQPVGAFAINYLADYLVCQDKEAEAAKYYRQVAVDFRKSNADASKHACDAIVRYYVRGNPSEPEFRKFYTDMGTLNDRPRTVPGNLTEDRDYWNTLRGWIRHFGAFGDTEDEARKAYYAYWAGQMQGKFRDDIEYGDDFHVERANFTLLASGDQAQWIQLIDEQYNRLQGRAGWERTAKWIRVYSGKSAKVEQYFKRTDLRKAGKDGLVELMKAVWETPDARQLARGMIDKLPFAEMSNAELADLALHFYEEDQQLTARFLSKIDFAKMTGTETASLAARFYRNDKLITRTLLAKVRWGEMEDEQIAHAARMFWSLDGTIVKDICLRTKDKAFGKWELLSYYHSRHHGWNPTAGLPLADELIKVEKYAAQAWWAKAEFHDALKQFSQAIAAYQNCQNAPENLWRIAACQVKLNKLASAVSQVREIENFFPAEAPKAALHVAHLYRNADEKKKYIQALRDVLKKYPESSQSKEAHVELENEGVRTGGGIDAN
jgi:TolA-binding protein